MAASIMVVFVGILLTALASAPTPTLADPPHCEADPPCRCSRFTKTLYCSDLYLFSVPLLKASSALSVILDFSVNQIHHLKANIFANLSNYDTLSISLRRNPLNSVDELAFKGLENCSLYLDMSKTKIDTLPSALMVLKNLKSLVFEGYLQLDVMATIGQSLEFIDVGNVFAWPDGLRYSKRLAHLRVHGKYALGLNHDAFQGLEDSLLDFEYLGSTLFTSPDAMCNLRNIQRLTMEAVLSPNKVSSLPNCSSPMASVHVLKLSSMNLTAFPDIPKVFPCLTSLEIVSSQVVVLPNNMSLPNLTSLTLRNISLTTVPSVVRTFERLQYLDLTDNKITTLTSYVFPLPYLRELDLERNQISVVADLAFRNAVSLTFLSLDNNNLTSVPRAFQSFPRETRVHIYIFGNPIECSCQLVWLLHWDVLTTGRTNLGGYCSSSDVGLLEYISSQHGRCQAGPIG